MPSWPSGLFVACRRNSRRHSLAILRLHESGAVTFGRLEHKVIMVRHQNKHVEPDIVLLYAFR